MLFLTQQKQQIKSTNFDQTKETTTTTMARKRNPVVPTIAAAGGDGSGDDSGDDTTDDEGGVNPLPPNAPIPPPVAPVPGGGDGGGGGAPVVNPVPPVVNNPVLNALVRLGFQINGAAASIVDANGQDLNNLDDFVVMDDDMVRRLCDTLRRPGGIDVANNQPDRGVPVSVKAETNLKLMCFYLRYMRDVQRPVTPNMITLASIGILREFRTLEKEHVAPDTINITGTDWPRNIDAMDDYFLNCRGTTSLPLSYIIREKEAVLPSEDDPQTNYTSFIDELTARAPLNGPTFIADRTIVWTAISTMARTSDWWTFVKKGQRTRDGRLSFLTVKNHYLGPNNVDHMAAEAEGKLQNLEYKGEFRNFNFEKFVQIQVDQHTITDSLIQHGYAGVDPRSRVRYLLDGIMPTSPLHNAKANILADPNMRKDFTACVTFLKDYLRQNKAFKNPSGANPLRISGVDQATLVDEGDADMSIPLRYYSRDEYAGLTGGQKLGLKLQRQKAGRGKTKKVKPKSKSSHKTTKQLIKASEDRMISAMATVCLEDAEAKEADAMEVDADSERNVARSNFRNRINKALKGKKRS